MKQIQYKKYLNNQFRGLSKNIVSFFNEKPMFQTSRKRFEVKKSLIWYFNSSSHLDFSSLFSSTGKLILRKLQEEGFSTSVLLCAGGPDFCQTGSSINNPDHFMPCYSCYKFNKKLHFENETNEFSKKQEFNIKKTSLSIDEIETLIEPSLGWIMRGDLENQKKLVSFKKNFIAAARKWDLLLTNIDENLLPELCIIFNGYTFPEVIVKEILDKRGVKTVTFENGILENSIFFTEGYAPDYLFPLKEKKLSKLEQQEISIYLNRRKEGNFERGGLKFWNEITSMDKEMKNKNDNFINTVTIFLNVPFDTSQVKANTLFKNMYEWLLFTKELVLENPETLFIYRSHPDESREDKRLFKPTKDWLIDNEFLNHDNVHIIDSADTLNSYELIEISKFIMVYNSTLALESILLNTNVLTAGNVHYSRIEDLKPPANKEMYLEYFYKLLKKDSKVSPEVYTEVERYFHNFTFQAAFDFSRELVKETDRKYSYSLNENLDINSEILNKFVNYINQILSSQKTF